MKTRPRIGGSLYLSCEPEPVTFRHVSDVVVGDIAPAEKKEFPLKEAAMLMHVSAKTLRQMVKRGDIEHFRIGTRGRGRKGRIYIPLHAIEEYKVRRTVKAKEPQRRPIRRTIPFVHLDPNWKPK